MSGTAAATDRQERQARLQELLLALRKDGLVADMVTPLRMRVSSKRTPGIEVDVICRPRTDDGGRLWFIGRDDKPLAPADRVGRAVTEVRKQAAVHL